MVLETIYFKGWSVFHSSLGFIVAMMYTATMFWNNEMKNSYGTVNGGW